MPIVIRNNSAGNYDGGGGNISSEAIEQATAAAQAAAASAAESADIAQTYAGYAQMGASTGGFVHLEERDGVLYCIVTGNPGINLFMRDGDLYYSYEEE